MTVGVNVGVTLDDGVIVLLGLGDITGFVGVFGSGVAGTSADVVLQAVRTTATNTIQQSFAFILITVQASQKTSAKQAG
jgi:hypothetical protein